MKVSWDDDIPNIWKNKIRVPNHQPDALIILLFPLLTIINHRLTIDIPSHGGYNLPRYRIPIPIGSMYAIYGNIYHQYTPNVSIWVCLKIVYP